MRSFQPVSAAVIAAMRALSGMFAGPCLVVAILLISVTHSEARIYWANFNNAAGSTLGRANLDQTDVQPSFITGAGGPCGVAADQAHVYWANWAAQTIGRSDKNGTDVNQSFIDSGVVVPCGVAVDSQYIYWANTFYGSGTTIGRANLDGSGANGSFITGAAGPCGVAVDSQYIYWANNGSGTIGRATLDGTTLIEPNFIPNAGDYPCGVAVNGAHIYWANSFTGTTIGRADLDGGNVVSEFIKDLPSPCGVAVGGGFIYWAEVGGGAIGRANLNGGNVDTGFIPTESSPCGVALDPFTPSVPATSTFGLGLFIIALIAAAIITLSRRRRPTPGPA